MSDLAPLRVVGVGSPHGDDAVGWAVVRGLREQFAMVDGIHWHLLGGGQGLLDVLDGRGTLWLVDALVSGCAAGLVRRFDWPDARVELLRPGSTHDLRPAEALNLAAALSLLPFRVVLFGIEIGSVGPDEELSPAVSAAVPELIRRMADELSNELVLAQTET